MAKLTDEADRAADLSGQLLPPQGAHVKADVPASWSSASAAACRTTMEELLTLPGVGRKTANLVLILAFKSREEHLRRHARPPHLEPARLGADAHAGGNRAGALSATRAAVVAVHQPVSGDVGAERLPAGLSALRCVRDPRALPADRRHQGVAAVTEDHEEDMICFCVPLRGLSCFRGWRGRRGTRRWRSRPAR